MKDDRHNRAVTDFALTSTVAQLAVHHSPAPTFVLTEDGSIRYTNPAASQIFHYDEASLRRAMFVDLLDEGSRAKGRMMLASAQHQPTASYELNQITGDQEILTVSYRALWLDDPSDSGGMVLLLGELMTPVMETTSRLLRLNQRLNALFELAASASRSLLLSELIDRALDVAIGELNLRAAAVFMRDDQDAAAETVTSHPESSPTLVAHRGFTAAFEQRMRSEQALPFMSPGLHHDTAWIRQGSLDELGLHGTELNMAVGPLLSLAVVPLRTEQALLGWLYVIADRYRAFTEPELDTLATIGNLLGPPIENTRLYAALLEKSGQLQAVLDGIDSGVLLVDRNDVVRYANQRLGRLIDEEVSSWPGQPRSHVFQQQLVAIHREDDLFGDDLWAIEKPTRRVLRRYVDEVADPKGVLLGHIEVYTDVTEAEAMNQLKEDFIAAAAHDLKTPVTAVKGYAQIALRQARRLEQTRLAEYLEMINTRSDELTFLMDSLLDVSRLQAGHLDLYCEEFDLARSVRTVEQHFAFDLQRRNRHLQVTMPLDPLIVRWDRLRIERVLINVVGNAVKYAPEGTPISIDVRHNVDDVPDTVEIEVTDHGVGIPLEERERVFERFYRTPQSLSDGIKGSGLGLYFCHRIVEEHAGRIWIGNASHGATGTTVHVAIPRALPDDEATLSHQH